MSERPQISSQEHGTIVCFKCCKEFPYYEGANPKTHMFEYDGEVLWECEECYKQSKELSELIEKIFGKDTPD